MRPLVRRLRTIVAAPLVALAGGCATVPPDGPARLESADEETLALLSAALGEALGRARVEFGPEDLATSGSLSVLPPPAGPFEDRSLAMPVVFDLRIENGACVAVRRDTGASAPLPGVRCRAADAGS